MALLNTYDPATTASVLNRLEKLEASTVPQWGKMDAAQMLAHLNVAYQMAYGDIEVKTPPFIMKWILKLIAKPMVVGTKPYPKNSRTAPIFLMTSDKDFEQEKAKLVNYIKRVEKDGEAYFEGLESASFGPLRAKEWSILFYKHLDHHFTQFGL